MLTNGDDAILKHQFRVTDLSQSFLKNIDSRALFFLADSPTGRALANGWRDAMKSACAVLCAFAMAREKTTIEEFFILLVRLIQKGRLALDMEVLDWGKLFSDLVGSPVSVSVSSAREVKRPTICKLVSDCKLHFVIIDAIGIIYDPSPNVDHTGWRRLSIYEVSYEFNRVFFRMKYGKEVIFFATRAKEDDLSSFDLSRGFDYNVQPCESISDVVGSVLRVIAHKVSYIPVFKNSPAYHAMLGISALTSITFVAQKDSNVNKLPTFSEQVGYNLVSSAAAADDANARRAFNDQDPSRVGPYAISQATNFNRVVLNAADDPELFTEVIKVTQKNRAQLVSSADQSPWD